MEVPVWIAVVAIVFIIAVLYAHRKQTRFEQEADGSGWFSLVIAKASEMSRNGELGNLEWVGNYLRIQKSSGAKVEDDFEQAKEFLDVACIEYLRGDVQQRDAIRHLFVKDSWWPLLEYADAQGRRIESQSNVDSLRRGLAAVSIAGLRIDYRDFLVCLGELYLKAEGAGIDPLPHFKEVADLSDKQTTSLNASTADLMGGFQGTAYFKWLSQRPEVRSSFAES